METSTSPQLFEAVVREKLFPLSLRVAALLELFRRGEQESFVDIAITAESALIGCAVVDLLEEDPPMKHLREIALTAETHKTAFAALSKIAAGGVTGALATIAEHSRHRLVRLAASGILAEDDGK